MNKLCYKVSLISCSGYVKTTKKKYKYRVFPNHCFIESNTGCSLNVVFFFKNSRKFATSPYPALGCYWLYKNYQPKGVTCIALRTLKVSYSDENKGEVAVNCEKITQFFLNPQ